MNPKAFYAVKARKHKFLPSRKLVLRINDISVYVTVKNVRAGIGADSYVNDACRRALLALEAAGPVGSGVTRGLTANYNGFGVQIDCEGC